MLDVWVKHLSKSKPRHISLHFNGIRIHKSACHQNGNASASDAVDVAGMCRQCEAAIMEETGYKVTIVEKKHYTLCELLDGISDRSRCNAGGCRSVGFKRTSSTFKTKHINAI